MLWSTGETFHAEPFELESELEVAILKVSPVLFGKDRIYLNAKDIWKKETIGNIPDGYLIDPAVISNRLASAGK